MLNLRIYNSKIALRWIPIVVILSVSHPVRSQDFSHSIHWLDLSRSSNNLIAQNSGIFLPPDVSQLLRNFGLTPVLCNDITATITIGSGTVCVRSTATIPSGNYTYDPQTNEIVPQGNPTAPVTTPPIQPSVDRPTSNLTVQFTFRTIAQYSNCLEDILQLYQDPTRFGQHRQHSDCAAMLLQTNATSRLSKARALELIQAANTYATTALSPALYPLQGLRRRIAQEFGFIYAIDTTP